MFDFMNLEKHTYGNEELIIELKAAIYAYNDASKKAIQSNHILFDIMHKFEQAAAREITFTSGKSLSWSDMLATGLKINPELRLQWGIADAANVEAREELIMAKNKVDALIAIVRMFAR